MLHVGSSHKHAGKQAAPWHPSRWSQSSSNAKIQRPGDGSMMPLCKNSNVHSHKIVGRGIAARWTSSALKAILPKAAGRVDGLHVGRTYMYAWWLLRGATMWLKEDASMVVLLAACRRRFGGCQTRAVGEEVA
ncbi:hypothetical protein H257_07038 [Aphanomyces astaci]|uniref:Uncharacterized protein n=1 Tax=Aphanomyces astaci TaxID=112090 RepID=W4GKE2_APHAT|nr:hypothetical protein H257_07038 [Aphanomyces astaci]ETV79821.1 hypothetical protein H257_07038 [Aphanomyces astaci]|eukprot:XP_009830757.1 hypothetical protein H257_07038 [Aphanomyces astaci]